MVIIDDIPYGFADTLCDDRIVPQFAEMFFTVPRQNIDTSSVCVPREFDIVRMVADYVGTFQIDGVIVRGQHEKIRLGLDAAASFRAFVRADIDLPYRYTVSIEDVEDERIDPVHLIHRQQSS
jgi:hypothetical protein